MLTVHARSESSYRHPLWLGNCIASSDVRDSDAYYDEIIIAQLYNTREFEYTSIYYNPVRIIRLTNKSRVVMWGERE